MAVEVGFPEAQGPAILEKTTANKRAVCSQVEGEDDAQGCPLISTYALWHACVWNPVCEHTRMIYN